MKLFRKTFSLFLLILLFFTGCESGEQEVSTTTSPTREEWFVEKKITYGEAYEKRDDVVIYLWEYKELPPNYITKKEAKAKGWNPQEGNLRDLGENLIIGGDYFGNREGLLPKKEGRKYFEADVNYQGGPRGAERLVYSNDGLIYYTKDHYKSFEKLRGDEG